MQFFTHHFKEFLSLKHTTVVEDKIFLEAQEEHKNKQVYDEALYDQMVHFIYRNRAVKSATYKKDSFNIHNNPTALLVMGCLYFVFPCPALSKQNKNYRTEINPLKSAISYENHKAFFSFFK